MARTIKMCFSQVLNKAHHGASGLGHGMDPRDSLKYQRSSCALYSKEQGSQVSLLLISSQVGAKTSGLVLALSLANWPGNKTLARLNQNFLTDKPGIQG